MRQQIIIIIIVITLLWLNNIHLRKIKRLKFPVLFARNKLNNKFGLKDKAIINYLTFKYNKPCVCVFARE